MIASIAERKIKGAFASYPSRISVTGTKISSQEMLG